MPKFCLIPKYSLPKWIISFSSFERFYQNVTSQKMSLFSLFSTLFVPFKHILLKFQAILSKFPITELSQMFDFHFETPISNLKVLAPKHFLLKVQAIWFKFPVTEMSQICHLHFGTPVITLKLFTSYSLHQWTKGSICYDFNLCHLWNRWLNIIS